MEQDLDQIVPNTAQKSCLLCFPVHPEWERLKGNVISEMRKMRDNPSKELEKQVFSKTAGALERLVQFMTKSVGKLDCQHRTMYKNFKKWTGFSVLELDNYAQDLHIYLVKKHYQIDMVLTQLKSVNKTVLESLRTPNTSQKTVEPKSQSSETPKQNHQTEFQAPLNISIVPMPFNFSPYSQQFYPPTYPPQLYYAYEFVDPRYFFPAS